MEEHKNTAFPIPEQMDQQGSEMGGSPTEVNYLEQNDNSTSEKAEKEFKVYVDNDNGAPMFIDTQSVLPFEHLPGWADDKDQQGSGRCLNCNKVCDQELYLSTASEIAEDDDGGIMFIDTQSVLPFEHIPRNPVWADEKDQQGSRRCLNCNKVCDQELYVSTASEIAEDDNGGIIFFDSQLVQPFEHIPGNPVWAEDEDQQGSERRLKSDETGDLEPQTVLLSLQVKLATDD